MKITTIILLFQFFVSAAKADLIFKCLEETSSGQRFESIIKQTDTKCRYDYGEISFIVSFTANIATFLIHKSRTYSNVDCKTLRMLCSIIGGLGPKLKAEDLTATGKTETINGYQTREFKGVVAGMETSIFVTENLPLQKKIKEMSRKWLNSPCADALQDLLAAQEGAFSSGLAMRTVREILGTTYSTTLESVDEVSLGDREFTVPNDYREVQFPLGH
jgi:hypothetical protein